MQARTEDRPRWGFALACAAASLAMVGAGALAGRPPWRPLAAPPPPPRSGGGFDPFGLVEANALAATPSLPTTTPPRRAARPLVKVGAIQVSGRLPPEVIGRIVRQNQGRLRLCYENGLGANPALQGRVTARFVIGRDGAVSNVANGGSDLPDTGVISCVVRSFYGLSFPQPDGGIATVSYSLLFRPR